MEDIITRVCDVDTSILETIAQLVIHLRRAKDADTETEKMKITTDRLE